MTNTAERTNAAPSMSRKSERVVWAVPQAIVAIVLILVVVLPLAWLTIQAFTVPGKDGGFTLGNFVDAFTNSRYLEAIWNSLRLGGSVMFACAVIGVPMAWLVSRTNMPGRRLLRTAVYSTFIMPSLITAVAWILLASPNSGLLNRLTDSMIGAKPFNAFSMGFLTMVIAFSLFSYTFTFTLNSLDKIGGEIEEAAAIAGAGPLRRALTVVLPLAAPAILGSMLVTFLQTIALFGAPALLALPAGQQVVPTQLFSFFGYPQQSELASAFAVPTVLVAAVLMWARKRMLGRRSFVTIGAKSGRTYRVDLGGWKWLASSVCWLLFVIGFVLPLGTLAYFSFSSTWYAPGSELTLDNYEWVFSSASEAVFNTWIFSASAATMCVVIGFLVAYLVTRRPSWLTRTMEFVATTPLVVPGLILAIGMFAAYSRPPLVIYGTGIVVAVAFFGRFLPVALQNIQPAVLQVNPELEQASRIAGAGFLRTLRSVTLPLVGLALLSAWIFTFVLSTQEVSAALLLVNPDTEVIPTMIMNLYEESAYERMAALGIVMVAVTMVAVAIGRVLIGRRFLDEK